MISFYSSIHCLPHSPQWTPQSNMTNLWRHFYWSSLENYSLFMFFCACKIVKKNNNVIFTMNRWLLSYNRNSFSNFDEITQSIEEILSVIMLFDVCKCLFFPHELLSRKCLFVSQFTGILVIRNVHFPSNVDPSSAVMRRELLPCWWCLERSHGSHSPRRGWCV